MIELKTSSSHSYPILSVSIHSDVVSSFFKEKKYKRLFLIVDENVWHLHQSSIEYFLQTNEITQLGLARIPSGESSKSVESWSNLTDSLLSSGLRRNDAVLVIGGGVTGDLGGFATSTALRGVALVHFPTTLLAMVDSSIGGKTGINHSSGKNRIGAFYQPDAVICDAAFLKTLPEQEWFCGIGEIIKYGCISEPELLDSLHHVLQKTDWKEDETWQEIIQKSAQIKAEIVQEDEKETGVRAHLNFGHTFAHAMERVLGFGVMSHGDAVFWGCIAACELSNRIGYDIPARVQEFLPFYQARFDGNLDIEALIMAMSYDKKNKSDDVTFVLLEKMGKAFTSTVSKRECVKGAWEFMLNLAKGT